MNLWEILAQLFAPVHNTGFAMEFLHDGMGSYCTWRKDHCMFERLHLDLELILEAVTTARHTRSIYRHPHVVRPTKKSQVTTCSCFRKSRCVCTCHSWPYTHTLAADCKSDNLLLEMCFGSISWGSSWPGATLSCNRSHCAHWRDPRSSVPIFLMQQLDFLPLYL